MNHIKDLAGDGSLYGDPSAVLAVKSYALNECYVVLTTGGGPTLEYRVLKPARIVAAHIDNILTEIFSEGDNHGYE